MKIFCLNLQMTSKKFMKTSQLDRCIKDELIVCKALVDSGKHFRTQIKEPFRTEIFGKSKCLSINNTDFYLGTKPHILYIQINIRCISL